MHRIWKSDSESVNSGIRIWSILIRRIRFYFQDADLVPVNSHDTTPELVKPQKQNPQQDVVQFQMQDPDPDAQPYSLFFKDHMYNTLRDSMENKFSL
jgi:hypothetical protein